MHLYGLYLIETPEDAALCEESGIFEFILEEIECENCAMAIGPLEDAFIPCSVLSGTAGEAWPVCVDCIAPMIFPGDWAEIDIEVGFDFPG